MLTLPDLLAPLDEATFFERHWEREPYLSRRSGKNRFRALFALEDLDRLLERLGRPAVHGLRLSGGAHGTARFHPGDQPVHLDGLRAAFEQGETLFINGAPERDERFRALGAALFSTFRCPLGINLMFTPAGARSYPAHFETHNVIALQLAGRKRWRLFAPTIEAPLRHVHQDHTVSLEALGDPLLDTTIETGDVLYLPRGFIHDVWTEDELSLHASVSIHNPSLRDLLVDLVRARAFDEPLLRRMPQMRTMLNDPKALAAELRKGIRSLESADFADLAADLETRGLLAELSLPGPRFTALDDTIDPKTRLRKRPFAVCRVSVAAGRASLVFQGNEVCGPEKLTPAFELIATRSEAFTPADLPGLADDERLVLCRRLIREGLLSLTK